LTYLHAALVCISFERREQLRFNRHSKSGLKLYVRGSRVVEIGEVVGIPELTDLLIGIRL